MSENVIQERRKEEEQQIRGVKEAMETFGAVENRYNDSFTGILTLISES